MADLRGGGHVPLDDLASIALDGLLAARAGELSVALAHVAACPRCRETLAELGRAATAGRTASPADAPAAGPPARVWHAIAAEVRGHRPASRTTAPEPCANSRRATTVHPALRLAVHPALRLAVHPALRLAVALRLVTAVRLATRLAAATARPIAVRLVRGRRATPRQPLHIKRK
ncbi:hypothetical protein ACH4UM_28930 [Streptomyces sp. NPDC020801]|uniref:hypothetical protein n=1 Tax=unclassified Streptomyces TaxID=2593676 RepID=UPI0037A22851